LKPAIARREFRQMTDRQITAWEDSVLKIPSPDLKIVRSDPAAGAPLLAQGNSSAGTVTTAVPQLRSSSDLSAYVPTTYIIGKSKAAGEIPFSSDVAPSGALTYHILK
jgi:hypothetical protein